MSVRPLVTEPFKTCGWCERKLAWSCFLARAKWPDGSMRRPDGICKYCRRLQGRMRQRAKLADPAYAAAERERAARLREQLRRDPEAWAEYQDRARGYRRAYKARRRAEREPGGQRGGRA